MVKLCQRFYHTILRGYFKVTQKLEFLGMPIIIRTMKELKERDKAPDFLKYYTGISKDYLKGKKIILYFYPHKT